MRKCERERSGVNVHLLCNLKYRLKADALLADISRTVLLSRVTDGANGSDVACREAILIRVNDDPVWVEFEGLKGFFIVRRRCRVRVVFSVLYKLI